jgi:hypothetical protein
MHYPDQPIDWEYLLDEFASPSRISFEEAPFQERMRFLFMCGMLSRVEALPYKLWRDHITTMIQTANFQYNRDNSVVLHDIREKIAYFEDEFPKLEEATTILELALWNMKMNENSHKRETTHSPKKFKTDVSDVRRQCRVTCGADIFIRLVLPFLITAVVEE